MAERFTAEMCLRQLLKTTDEDTRNSAYDFMLSIAEQKTLEAVVRYISALN